jgi:putative oxidoreductase
MNALRRLLQAGEPRVLSILRIVVGLLYLEHGMQKIFNFPPSPKPRAYELFTLVPGLAGIMEFVGGILIILGLFTRPVAFLLSGEMAFAYFMSHAPRGFYPISNGGEPAILYCFIFLYFCFVGAGVWSLDEMRSPRGRASAGRAAIPPRSRR